jgi:serine/threonine protein kinase
VVNRDLKPENLLLKRKVACQDARCTLGNLRCVDFGSAALLQEGADTPAHSLPLWQ